MYSITSVSQRLQSNLYYFVDREQDRIDSMDMHFDRIVRMNNEENTLKATNIFIYLVDSIQASVAQNDSINEQQKYNLMGHLNLTLRSITERNLYLLSYHEKVLTQIYQIVKTQNNKDLSIALYKNMYASTQIIPYYKHREPAFYFLLDAAKSYPDIIFKNYGDFADQPWATKLVCETAKSAPLSVKKYLGSAHPIRSILYNSNDSIIKLIIGIYKNYGSKTNAYTLLDGIYNGNISLEKADSIGSVDLRYLIHMLKIRKQENPLAENSLNKELEFTALKYVRNINELHDIADPKIRFGIADNLTPAELYTLIVYSEDEIFTSTFLGLFERMLTRMQAQRGDELLAQVGYNRFRTFIKLCAGFNTLDRFLKTMDPEARKEMLLKFVHDLEKDRGNLSAPVEVADAFGSISDSSSLATIEYALIKEYARVEYQKSREGQIIYGLLMTLFKDKAVLQKEFFNKVSQEYQLPVIDKILFNDIVGPDSTNVQLHFFFDDDDGKASFKTYIETFSSAGWQINKQEKIVVITHKNKKVIILANYPESEETGGHEAMMEYCDSASIIPHIIVHRGHSYYAMKTIERVNAKTRIVFLGSCGGYNNLSEIIDRSPDVQIIATKQIGTMFVNNPLLLQLANTIGSSNNIDWIAFWSNLEKSVKANKAAYDRFVDYIPPYKNLGAIFIQSYRKAL